MLVCAQLGSLLQCTVFSLSNRPFVKFVFIFPMLLWKETQVWLQPLIYYHRLNEVKCGGCQQHCFIWQWWICLWTCWQDSIGELFGKALKCVSGYYCASCTVLWWANFLFNTHIFSRLSFLLIAQSSVNLLDVCSKKSSVHHPSSTFCHTC